MAEAVSLGVHVGHHASAAVVIDGRLVAAVQQERVTRVKHDGSEGLSAALPVAECLRAAGRTLSEVTAIVSSFQATGPASFGLHRPLVYPDFEFFRFDDRRHQVISHHLAHAWCAYGSSAWNSAAILVCDLAGTSSVDGADFALPSLEWRDRLISDAVGTPEVRTECLSLYRATGDQMELLDRDYVIPHNAPFSFVQSVASLYDNVTFRIFGDRNAPGQTMALAAHADGKGPGGLSPERMVTVDGDHVTFHNDWQPLVPWDATGSDLVGLAQVCQDSAERAISAYANRARRLTGLPRLAVAGGVFLNIHANARLREAGPFDEVYVPSAPHDGGVSVGCAFYADAYQRGGSRTRVDCDLLGPRYATAEVDDAVREGVRRFGLSTEAFCPEDLATLLAEGHVIARWNGRSEFGPRALGARSLLAAADRPETKDRLNAIKGRQAWRPVAPIIPREASAEYLSEAAHTPFMNMAYSLRPKHRGALAALSHPDHSTRPQTLDGSTDPALYEVLRTYGRLTGHPVLCNTSLNGRSEPIIERPAEAIDFFARRRGIHALLLEDRLLTR